MAIDAPTSRLPVFPRTSSSNRSPRSPILDSAGYARVSTSMQAEYGVSIDSQTQAIKKYCSLMGHQLEGIYIDQQSAKNSERPDFIKMLKAIDAGKINYVIVTKLDRFSRSQKDFYEFMVNYVEKDKCHLICIFEGIDTSLFAGRNASLLLIACGQIERNQISERVKSTIAYMRQQGAHFGKVPFGYTTVSDGKLRRLVKHPENYAWLEKMAEWYRSGISFSEIAEKLNSQGVKPSQSKKWTKTSVYDLLIKERIHVVRAQKSDRVYDRVRAYELAYRLKLTGCTHQEIANRLNEEGLRPGKASEYHWWSAQELLRSAVYYDRSTPVGCAKYWKAQGLSLRAIAIKLMENGHTPKRGGQWFAQQVKQLLIE